MGGSLREYRPGCWLLRIDLGRDALSGRRIQASRTVRGTRRQAQEALDEFKVETRTRRAVPSSMTLAELADRWLETPTRSGRKRTSISVYNTRKRFDRYVKPTLGNRSIGDLRSSDITLLLDAMTIRHGLSPATAGRVRSEIRTMLGWAWRRDLVAENVALKADVPSVPPRKLASLTCDQLVAHLEIAAIEDPDLELTMMIAASLGLRRSEIVALRWSHIDFNRGLLHIREGIVKAPGSDYETTPTKTGPHGFADFPLHPGLLERLRARREAFRSRLTDLGEVDIADGYLFSSDPSGQSPLHPDTVTTAFRKHCQRHPELPRIGSQILRKYAASDLFGEGEDQVIAAAILRDTPETTARHYRAVNQERARQAVIGIFERIETHRDALDTRTSFTR